ncbi:MAG: hypothetical protein GY694_15715, partial [Gammaproteobacteria bacterium]|nr:hypothetical protein [Gammaproteobacteria bacterium]
MSLRPNAVDFDRETNDPAPVTTFMQKLEGKVTEKPGNSSKISLLTADPKVSDVIIDNNHTKNNDDQPFRLDQMEFSGQKSDENMSSRPNAVDSGREIYNPAPVTTFVQKLEGKVMEKPGNLSKISLITADPKVSDVIIDNNHTKNNDDQSFRLDQMEFSGQKSDENMSSRPNAVDSDRETNDPAPVTTFVQKLGGKVTEKPGNSSKVSLLTADPKVSDVINDNNHTKNNDDQSFRLDQMEFSGQKPDENMPSRPNVGDSDRETNDPAP